MTALGKRVAELRAQGLSLRAIARELGVGYGTAQKLAAEKPAAPPAPPRPPLRCEWPTSDGRPWTFCQEPRAPGSLYCAAHHRLAYNKRAAA